MNLGELLPFVEATVGYGRQRGIRRTEGMLTHLETSFTREIAEIFREQGRIVAEKFTEIMGGYFREDMRADSDYIMNIAIYMTHQRFANEYTRYSFMSWQIGRESFGSSVGVETSFDLYDARAYEYLRRRAGERITGINEQTRTRIREIITNGYAEGKTYQEIARDIKGEFEAFAVRREGTLRSRAELVAVTELRDAHEDSQLQQAQDFIAQGYQMEKAWLVRDDEKLCEICRMNGADGWIAFDAVFASGHFMATAHPGCRCRTLWRIKPGTLTVRETVAVWAGIPQGVAA